MDFIDEVVTNKFENPEHPHFLLHFWDRHYSALLRTGRVKQHLHFEEEMDSKMTGAKNLANKASITRAETYTNANMQQLALRTALLDISMFGRGT